MVGTLAVMVVFALVATAFVVSPRPGSFLIRLAFDREGAKTAKMMERYVPAGVTGSTDVPYGPGDDEKLDVWFPETATAALPTIVWVHGGAWVAGDKSTVAPYLKILASHGYTAVGINYSIAPGARYPTPVRQTNSALAWLVGNAAEHHVDPSRMILAGDSAGAQIAAQVAALTVDPAYAADMEIAPAITPEHLLGTVLNCGPYDPVLIENVDGLTGWFVRTVAWAYLGTKDFDDPRVEQATVVDRVTAQYPPTWISGGNGDPLTPQGRAMASRLTSLGVDVTSVFFPDGRTPALGHEYQFQLDTPAAQQALSSTVRFLAGLVSR